MHVLNVREATKYAADHCRAGKGPFVLEMDTYRYHGHSMSDPGITYRDRTEVSGVREKRDPVQKARNWLVELFGMEDKELKGIESGIRKDIEAQLEKAKAAPAPEDSALWLDIYKDQNPNFFIRGCDMSGGTGDFKSSEA